MAAEPIRADEWLAELSRLSAINDEGMTTAELVEETGRSEKQVRDWLRQAAAKGWVKVGRRTVPGIDGRLTPVPVYRVEPT